MAPASHPSPRSGASRQALVPAGLPNPCPGSTMLRCICISESKNNSEQKPSAIRAAKTPFVCLSKSWLKAEG